MTSRSLIACVLLLLVGASGCHRAHYRRQADAEAYQLIREKNGLGYRNLPRIDIQMSPQSRMFDPFDPDAPPMPPDDPASHELMQFVDGKRNYKHWYKDGVSQRVENPSWEQSLPVDDRGVLKLDLATAINLALVHSTEYQEALEDLYLSALDVSAERFQFDAMLFGGSSIFYRSSGAESVFDPSRLRIDSNLMARKMSTTGGELLANLANFIVWDLSGPNINNSFSIFDFSFVQPFLRGAGKDRVMTRLTLAERQLLANVRQMERFRRGFFLERATGDGGTRGPNRIGGLFGGSGLQGFTGVGGGFGLIGGAFGGGGGIQDASAALQVGGFYGLLQDLQNIRNQQTNIAGLRTNVVQFQQTLNENLRTIPEDPTEVVRNRLQVAQARQNLYSQEFALQTAQAQFQTQVDDFKLDLGLPPHVPIEISDPWLEQFNLLDPEIVPVQDEVGRLSDIVGAINEWMLRAVEYQESDGRRVGLLTWSDGLATNLENLRRNILRLRALQQQTASRNLARARADVEKLKQVLPRRRQTIARLHEKYPSVLQQMQQLEILYQVRLPIDIDPEVLNVARLDRLEPELETELARLTQQLQSYAARLERLDAALRDVVDNHDDLSPADLYQRLEENVIFVVPSLLAQLSSDLLDLSLVQARARADSIDLVPVELGMKDALYIASQNRRDWMNARASLVDTWRAIPFVANDLEGVIDLVVDGEIRTVGDNPLDFQSKVGTIRTGFQFDAPFTRLLERNNYREVLIDYQRSRRDYYRFIDRVSQGLRNTIRTLDLNELNFETRRLAVLSAVQQIVLNDEIRTLNEERGEAQGVTAARDIISALADLQEAQDDFMGVWIIYEVNRRFLDFDLGTMQLDETGMWVDPGEIRLGVEPYVLPELPNCESPLLAPSDQPPAQRRGAGDDEGELLPLPPVADPAENPAVFLKSPDDMLRSAARRSQTMRLPTESRPTVRLTSRR